MDKNEFIQNVKDYGSGPAISAFLEENESFFKDVLKENGFKNFQEFEDWGANGADNDWDKYDRIYFECLKKIPAEKFNIK